MPFTDLKTCPLRSEAPRLTDGDVTLRPHVLQDFADAWEFYQTTDRAGFIGAPDTPTKLWYGLSSEIVSWQLRGFGSWAILFGDQFAGQVAVTQPPHFPEIEIGWTLLDGFEGRSIASRAAQIALDWVWSETDLTTLVSYITPENERSRKLAERLGAAQDPNAPLPTGESPEETVVYRHRRPPQ
ncbi:MAG: GNAT family N-acetyltransferase [Pseudomonadota bacterium]